MALHSRAGADLLAGPDDLPSRGDCCMTGPIARSAALTVRTGRLAKRLKLLGLRTVYLAGAPFRPIVVPGELAGRSRHLSERIGPVDDRLGQPNVCSGGLSECPRGLTQRSGRLSELPRQLIDRTRPTLQWLRTAIWRLRSRIARSRARDEHPEPATAKLPRRTA